MQGGAFFGPLFLQIVGIGWCATAVVLFLKLVREPGWPADWIKYLLSGLAAALGATVALIPLGIAVTMLVCLLSPGGFGLLILLPPLALIAAIVVIVRAIEPPSRPGGDS